MHLRNVTKEPDGSFEEAEHLRGYVEMVATMVVLLEEQQRRRAAGQEGWRIPFRPYHGQVLVDDGDPKAHLGYPLVGRLRGLAELQGDDGGGEPAGGAGIVHERECALRRPA